MDAPDWLSGDRNPLLAESPEVWQRLIEKVGPASLLVVIERRMSSQLKLRMSAEDLLQEALLHAWRDRRQFQWRGLRNFRSWLLTIIDHRVKNAAAHEAAQKRGGEVTTLPISTLASSPSSTGRTNWPGPAVSTTPSKVAMYKERASAMQEAIAALPADLRAIVALRLFEQRPLEEIAAQMGIGVEAVRHRFRKGCEMYRARLLAVFESRSRSIPRDGTDEDLSS